MKHMIMMLVVMHSALARSAPTSCSMMVQNVSTMNIVHREAVTMMTMLLCLSVAKVQAFAKSLILAINKTH